MSSGDQEHREELLRDLALQARQLNGLGAAFYRAVAGRVGMNAADVEVLDILSATGPAVAGRLAELTGLTTGAITQMLNRLEEAGLVRRERDPEDGRRVIVRLAAGADALGEVSAVFDSVETAWEELASEFDDEQIAVLLAFLKRGNALSRQELVRLRVGPEGEEGSFSAPLLDVASGQLVATGVAGLTVRADAGMAELYQARFEGPAADLKAKDGVVTLRYPRRLWLLGGVKRAAEVALNPSIPWRIAIKGGASMIAAELGGLDLAGLEVSAGASMVRLELPAPTGVVPIRIRGDASEVVVRRPAGVAARAHLKGWTSTFVFDDQRISEVGNDVRLQSRGYDAGAPSYDFEVSSSASMVTIVAE